MAWLAFSQQGDHHAWNTLAGHAPGNSGTSGALERLHNGDVSIRDLDLRPVSLAHAGNFKTGDVHRTNVNGVMLNKADLSRGWFSYTDFSNSELVDANLIEVKWDNSIINNVDFTGARVNYSTLTNTTMVGTTLNHAQFIHADFHKALLTVHGENVNAEKANFHEATIRSSFFDGFIAKNSTFSSAKIIGSWFTNSDFSFSDMNQANFVDSVLRDTNFSDSKMYEVSFYDVNLSGTDFTNAKGMTTVRWVGSWVWKDELPKIDRKYSEILSQILVYDRECVQKNHGTSVSREERPLEKDCVVQLENSGNFK